MYFLSCEEIKTFIITKEEQNESAHSTMNNMKSIG